MTHKFLLHTFAGLLAAAALSACNNRDDENNDNNVNDNTITVAVENGSSYNDKIDAVKALVGYDVDGVGSEVGSAPYANGGFTLQLQANVDAQYLEALFDNDAALFTGATVSNPNVKGTWAKIVACKSDKEVGEFSCGEEDDYVQGQLVYVDSDVSVTGAGATGLDYIPTAEIQVSYTFNLHLKKGWSMIYTNTAVKNGEVQVELTTTAPSGVKWLFSAYSTAEIIDNTITATVENGSSYNDMVDTVKALVGYDVGGVGSEVGSGPYANGGFTLRLQASVGEQYLEPMFEGDTENPFAEATISNPNVKGALATVFGYKSGEQVALISAYSSTASGLVAGQLVYVNDDVSVTGSGVEDSGEEPFSYSLNLHLKRGWNMMYVGEIANGVEITTTPPTNMAWSLMLPDVWTPDEDYDQLQPLSGASLKKQLQAPSKRMKKALKMFW
jgi:hypothetical protein